MCCLRAAGLCCECVIEPASVREEVLAFVFGLSFHILLRICICPGRFLFGCYPVWVCWFVNNNNNSSGSISREKGSKSEKWSWILKRDSNRRKGTRLLAANTWLRDLSQCSHVVRWTGQKSGGSGLKILGSAPISLKGCRQITWPLWASVSLPIKWDFEWFGC